MSTDAARAPLPPSMPSNGDDPEVHEAIGTMQHPSVGADCKPVVRPKEKRSSRPVSKPRRTRQYTARMKAESVSTSPSRRSAKSHKPRSAIAPPVVHSEKRAALQHEVAKYVSSRQSAKSHKSRSVVHSEKTAALLQEIATSVSTSSSRQSAKSHKSRSVAHSGKKAALLQEAAKLMEIRKKIESSTSRRIAEIDIEASRQKEILRAQEQRELDIAENEGRLAEVVSEMSVLDEESDVDSILSDIPSLNKTDFVRDFVNRHSPVNDFKPAQQTANPPERAAIQGWVQHFIKRDFLTNSLVNFDDNPENFRAWKMSFRNVVDHISLNPSEELNMLVKWCGNHSAELVKKIRAVHVNKPEDGLNAAWKRLEENFGQPEVVSLSLIRKVKDIKKISRSNHKALRDFGDGLLMLEYAKEDDSLPGLEYLDTFMGINPLTAKLPEDLQNQWRTRAYRYKQKNNGRFPPFTLFSKFVRDVAEERCDPSFSTLLTEPMETRAPTSYKPQYHRRSTVNVSKTEVDKESKQPECPLHNRSSHTIEDCRYLRAQTLNTRREIIRKAGLCLRCLTTTSHIARNCNAQVSCKVCGSDRHPALLHPWTVPTVSSTTPPEQGHGGERTEQVTTSCIQVCGSAEGAKSCAKICLAKVYHEDRPDIVVRTYVVMDDQSNRSLARSTLFEKLSIATEALPYTLTTCSGKTDVFGRRAQGLVVESLNGKVTIPLPTVLECDDIPHDRSEIPSPQAASQHEHLRPLAESIPKIETDAGILLLIGRDVPQVHKVRQSRNGPNDAPWAQRLDLGWVILGEVCIGKAHRIPNVSTYRTQVLENGRPSMFEPCGNRITITEQYLQKENFTKQHMGKFVQGQYIDDIGEDIYKTTEDDNKISISIEDGEFMELMAREMTYTESGHLIAPLPFKHNRTRLPNNRDRAHARLQSLIRSFQKKPELRRHYTTFMETMLSKGHAKQAPPISPHAETWYLPHFGVYHPKKPGKIRVVFDSSDKYKGCSLNDTLLMGPDLLNSLLGILIRFRSDSIACVADIEQMFYSFYVKEEHRDFLRFLWFKDNDPDKEVIEYRMHVHIFGNRPSPAVATFGLRKVAQEGQLHYGQDAKEFVERNFYVDDGLLVAPTPEQAIEVLKQTKDMLAVANLRLHKIVSNSQQVMDAFPMSERASDICNLDLDLDDVPLQRSLGILWNIQKDAFTFQINLDKKRFTKRCVLSTINSIYDPLGFVQPVVIGGKILLRQMTQAPEIGWDDDLPQHLAPAWNSWRHSLLQLDRIQVPRAYTPQHMSTDACRRELHVFADASQQAIAAVAYLRVVDSDRNIHVSFVMGKAKLAPKHAVTIPRLELNSTLLAVELAETIVTEISLKIDDQRFYTDSQVVMGYLTNRTKRFYVYVANRVQRILKFTTSSQWSHIPTHVNPADHATRSVAAENLEATSWLQGPDFLKSPEELTSMLTSEKTFHTLPDDAEIRPDVSTYSTSLAVDTGFDGARFTRFSRWDALVRATAHLIRIARCLRKKSCKVQRIWHFCPLECEDFVRARTCILRCAQRQTFISEVGALQEKRYLPRSGRLLELNPFLDEDGIMRVGGRIRLADLDYMERHPVILCATSHVSTLLVRHYHERVHHQGHHFTTGAIRGNGFWILGCKSLVKSVIHKCIQCRKQRGKPVEQIMADLPRERLLPEPPFSCVGVDVFGHWFVTHRRTRSCSSQAKRWAVLFTCFSTRAIHIELSFYKGGHVWSSVAQSTVSGRRLLVSLEKGISSVASTQREVENGSQRSEGG